MSLVMRTLRACSGRLTVCKENYTVSNIEELLQVLTILLAMIAVIAIDPGQVIGHKLNDPL